MTDEHAAVKCGTCNLALQGPDDPKPNDVFSCPRCGQGDRLDTIEREVLHYLQDFLSESLDRALADLAQDYETVRRIGNAKAHKAYRFIAGPDLY